jgi:hypothetical protein
LAMRPNASKPSHLHNHNNPADMDRAERMAIAARAAVTALEPLEPLEVIALRPVDMEPMKTAS